MFGEGAKPITNTIPAQRIELTLDLHPESTKGKDFVVLFFVPIGMITVAIWLIDRLKVVHAFSHENRELFHRIPVLA